MKIGTIGFGVWTVSGLSRVPLPPASRMAFIAIPDDTRSAAVMPKLRPARELRGILYREAQPARLEQRMNLPNALTLGRIFLVPLLVVVLLTKFEGRLIFGVRKELVGAAIFGVASLTDWLDGYLARRRKQITTLGQLMDPLADKLLITARAGFAGADGSGAGLDGGGDHRPRVRGHGACAASLTRAAWSSPPRRSARSRWFARWWRSCC